MVRLCVIGGPQQNDVAKRVMILYKPVMSVELSSFAKFYHLEATSLGISCVTRIPINPDWKIMRASIVTGGELKKMHEIGRAGR